MTFSIRWRLSAMMALQYGVAGAWMAVAGKHFTALGPERGFTGVAVGLVFALAPIATSIVPFFAGHVADRWVNQERLLAALHGAGAVCLFGLAQQRTFADTFWWMLAYAVLTAPTAALTNALAFRHVSNVERDFSGIRVWGTIGWILAGWTLSGWRAAAGNPVPGDLFFLAGALSALMAAASLLLPATPPERVGAHPLAFVSALRLLRQPEFLAFLVISFVASTALDFHYVFASAYLGAPRAENGLGIADSALPAVMSVAQLSEIGVMLLLPMVLRRLGVRRALTLGTLAWAVRYGVFALADSRSVVVASLALHGFCVSFYFVTIYIYADQVAPRDARASVQSLVMLVISGVGRLIGSFVAGATKQACTHTAADGRMVTDWPMVFALPALVMLACAAAFPLLFRPAGPPRSAGA